MKNKINSILKEIRPEVDTFLTCEDFIQEGMLDSFDIINLISQLGSCYQIDIDPLDVTPENFKNIESIERLINVNMRRNNV